MDDAIYERAMDLLEADLQGEMVALDPNGGQCFGFNEVATSVWRLLESPRSLAELTVALGEEYEIDEQRCRAELAELLDDLCGRGLIRARASIVSAPPFD